MKMHELLYTFNNPNAARIGAMASVMHFRREKDLKFRRTRGWHLAMHDQFREIRQDEGDI